MQSLTFIIFIVSEKIVTLKVFTMLDDHPAGWPNTDHYKLTFAMWINEGTTWYLSWPQVPVLTSWDACPVVGTAAGGGRCADGHMWCAEPTCNQHNKHGQTLSDIPELYGLSTVYMSACILGFLVFVQSKLISLSPFPSSTAVHRRARIYMNLQFSETRRIFFGVAYPKTILIGYKKGNRFLRQVSHIL